MSSGTERKSLDMRKALVTRISRRPRKAGLMPRAVCLDSPVMEAKSTVPHVSTDMETSETTQIRP